MKILKTITIDKPIDDVWKVLAEDFDQAGVWMSGVYHSKKLIQTAKDPKAPMAGRVCDFSAKENAFYADEYINNFDEKNHILDFTVYPKNGPAFLPVNSSDIHVTLKEENGHTQVNWEVTPHLKPFGVLLSPLLKVGLGQFFGNLLREMKFYTETGEIAPSKHKYNKKVGLE